MINNIAITADGISYRLTKKNICLLNDISFNVNEGTMIGLASANSKETTALLNIIANNLFPSEGVLKLKKNFFNISHPTERHISSVFSTKGFFSELSLFNNLYIGTAKARQHFFLNKPLLTSKAKKIYAEFGFKLNWLSNCESLNERKRVEASLVRCFLADASVYIFDEFIDELDQHARKVFFAKCKKLTSQGCIVFYSTKIPENLIGVCSKTLILRLGKTVYFDSPSSLSSSKIRCLLANNLALSSQAITDELKLLSSEQRDPINFTQLALQSTSLFLSAPALFCIYKDRMQQIHYASELNPLLSLDEKINQLANDQLSLGIDHKISVEINSFIFNIRPLIDRFHFFGLFGINNHSKNSDNELLNFPFNTFVEEFSACLSSLLIEQALIVQSKQKQRLSSLGSLAGGLVHDVNNSLFAISGAAELLTLQTLNEKQKGYVSTILTVVSDTRNLTSKLLSFSKKGGTTYDIANINQIVEDSLIIAMSGASDSITLKTDFLATSTTIECDVSEIRNSLVNVILNACQAVDQNEGGILVKINNYHNTKGETDFEGNLLPDHSVVISIIDNGIGMSQATLSKIFEPFFSTRSNIGGTGLGLPVVYGTIKEHNGNFIINSRPNHGTQFNIYLPLSDAIIEQEIASRPTLKKFDGKTILLCDDNKQIQANFKEMLEGLGIKVLTASDAFECIQQYDSHQAEIDLLILDDIMPVMTGRECFYQLKTNYSDLAAIMITGYRDDPQIDLLLKDGLLGIFKKPLLLDEIIVILNCFLK